MEVWDPAVFKLMTPGNAVQLRYEAHITLRIKTNFKLSIAIKNVICVYSLIRGKECSIII